MPKEARPAFPGGVPGKAGRLMIATGAFLPGYLTGGRPLGWGFKKAFSFTYIVKTPFDLLALSCGLATAVNNKSKGGHYG